MTMLSMTSNPDDTVTLHTSNGNIVIKAPTYRQALDAAHDLAYMMSFKSQVKSVRIQINSLQSGLEKLHEDLEMTGAKLDDLTLPKPTL